MSIKRIVKTYIWQRYIRLKFRKSLTVGKDTALSKDFYCEVGCKIGRNVIIGRRVKLQKGVKIGSYSSVSNVAVGENSVIESRVIFTGSQGGAITIGKESYVGVNNVLDYSDNITIGDYVHIAGPTTGLWTHTSAKMCINSIQLNDKSIKYRPTAPIVIESNVYIGGNCTIYPGVTIGHHSIVAPNSAVSKNVPPYSLVGGVPAKFIKRVQVDE